MNLRVVADLIEIGIILCTKDEYMHLEKIENADKHGIAEICRKFRVEFLRKGLFTKENDYYNITDFMNNRVYESLEILETI